MTRGWSRFLATVSVLIGLVLGGAAIAGAEVTITEYATGLGQPTGFTAGPDGALWFTGYSDSRIGRITTDGVVTEYSTGITPGAGPRGITAGPDGALWFTEYVGNRIGRITTNGVVTEYSAGISASSYPFSITAGPDGALWFTEELGNRIGRITVTGEVTEYSAGIAAEAWPYGITAGPDGALWFTEYNGGRIGRISTAAMVTEYSTGITSGAGPKGITVGPDGALWFTEFNGGRIGRITTAGVVTEYSVGIGAGAWPEGITTGRDGALWFTELSGNRLGRITTAGVVAEYSAGIAVGAWPYGITAGPDGALWFTEFNGGRIGRAAVAGPGRYRSWLSAVAHVDVPATGASWRSDIAILNRTATTAQLELRAYTAGGVLTMPSSVGPNAQVIFKDVAAQLGVTLGSAALEVRSTEDFSLSGRTYNQIAVDATTGQDYDGMDPSKMLSTGHAAYLTQLTQNSYYRTNIGVTNASTEKASVTVTIHDGTSGMQLWIDTRAYDPGEFHQYNQPLKALGRVDNAYAKVTVNSGSGVFGYASVIDQKTNDATTVVMKNRTSGPQIMISEYCAGISADAHPWSIVAGPDGAMWFTESWGNRIGRITAAGVVTEYSAGDVSPVEITAGPDGALWFTKVWGDRIGRITTAGVVTEYPSGIVAGTSASAITAGPDGALWFTMRHSSGHECIDGIGRITTAGVATTYWAGITAGSCPSDITAGPDGALWFTESRGSRIGRITTAGVVTEYAVGTPGRSWIQDITTGPDGALWFTGLAGGIGRITTAGVVTEYSAGITAGSGLSSIAVGPDGALWFTEPADDRIGRITTDGAVTEYSAGIATRAFPASVAAGPDGALWFTENGVSRIGRITGLTGLPYSTWLPAVAHVDVPATGASWRSDLAVLNRGSSTTMLELRAHTSGGILTMSSSVEPNAQITFKDVAAQLGLTNGSAALEVRSSADIHLSGRTYNQVAFDTTYGQDYDGTDPSTLLSAGHSAYLTQLTQNAYYRSNLGVTNAGTGTASVTVTIHDGVAGTPLWSDTRNYDPGEFFQYNQPLKSLGTIDNAYARLTVNSGSGVFSYASVIDRKTNDATTVVMKR